MEIKEYLSLRSDLIEKSFDEDQVFSEDSFLYTVLPDLMEVKLIDSEDINYTYLKTNFEGVDLKINGYTINESGERLQIFIVNDKATSLDTDENELMVSLKNDYQNIFNQAEKFITNSIKRYLNLHDSDRANFLVHQLGSSEFIYSIDVIEIFLISPTLTVETRGKTLSPKRIEFNDEEYKTSYTLNRKKSSKEILLVKKLIDLNFLYDISVSKGAKYDLEINFDEIFNSKIEVLKAADEENFESYLCVLPAEGIASLYRRYSTRLLEKNVRSFLNFRVAANKAMRDTIRNTPERFIAFNNGLTITAKDKTLVEADGKYYLKTLKDFQIVNGGQTTASIFFSKKDGLDISKINLMAKINIAKNLSTEDLNELISDISLYSNTQSKVSKVDLKSRNPQIDKIKALSNSVVTSDGKKWFFEKARGEFSTMVRLAGGNKKRVEKEYPRERRLTKVEMGKYFTSWGDKPWLVKKGGEKVFRSFIETISGEGTNNKAIDIDRQFYETLIAKSILFRRLESLHGTRNNAIGQLRSAVVPYTISVLYIMFEGTSKRPAKFDLENIWALQGIQDDLKVFLVDLMKLQYVLIKKYATSDDLGENTKKEELWEKIRKSPEIKSYISSKNAEKIKKKYYKEPTKRKSVDQVDFSHILDIVEIISKGRKFYTELRSRIVNYNGQLEFKERSFDNYIGQMFGKENYKPENHKLIVPFFKDLFKNLQQEAPHLLDGLTIEDNNLMDTINGIINIYNDCISSDLNISSEFDKYSIIASNKGVSYPSSLSQIGKSLENGIPPSLKYIYYASNYFKIDNKLSNKVVNLENDIFEGNFYLKKICTQDVIRTPSLSSKAAKSFFNLEIKNGESTTIPFYFEDNLMDIEINLRKTRNEYRIFFNHSRNIIKYQVDDILLIKEEGNAYRIELIKHVLNTKESPSYSKALKLLNESLHGVFNS